MQCGISREIKSTDEGVDAAVEENMEEDAQRNRERNVIFSDKMRTQMMWLMWWNLRINQKNKEDMV